ncbi:translation protein [Pelagophyceae sp. CCMP2097]|nr:translation protein [Pelagophyceae sp. CCMP2097]
MLFRRVIGAFAPRARVVGPGAVRSTQSNGRLSAARGEVRRRTGVVAVKVGMMSTWDNHGMKHAITVLRLDGCRVVQVKEMEKEGYTAMQMGAGTRKAKHVNKPQMGHFLKWQGDWEKDEENAPWELLRHVAEFRVSPDALLPVGTEISAAHFKPGQFVDIQGVTRGKGFQGGMKRHGFGGGNKTHGNTKAHRKIGSVGSGCQDPGRVLKGKKMPGRMGGKNRTIQNIVVHRIDRERDLVFIRGAVPGSRGRFVRVTDALKKYQPEDYLSGVLPFPTITTEELAALPEVIEWSDEPGPWWQTGGNPPQGKDPKNQG